MVPIGHFMVPVTRFVFRGAAADGRAKIYTIPADGGTPEAVTAGKGGEDDPTWSPDGNGVMFSDGGNTPDSNVKVLSLNTHTVTEIPGSKGLFSPRWSPDGRYAAALTVGNYKLMLFDFKTQKWEALSGGGASFPNWSKDVKYVYFDELGTPAAAFFRVEIATRRIEEVARLGNAHPADGIAGLPWVGVTPDGSPRIARQAGSQEIYALDVDFP